MSGHDETFVPPDEGEAKLPPHPPAHAPPNFGQSSVAGKPSVVFQTADTQPGIRAFSGSSVASDAEETMTPPPPKRPGAATPDAQHATNPNEAADGPPQPYGTAPLNGDHAAAPPPPPPPPHPPTLRRTARRFPRRSGGSPRPRAGTAVRPAPRPTRPRFRRRRERSPMARARSDPAPRLRTPVVRPRAAPVHNPVIRARRRTAPGTRRSRTAR
jgi:hypothetical protein